MEVLYEGAIWVVWFIAMVFILGVIATITYIICEKRLRIAFENTLRTMVYMNILQQVSLNEELVSTVSEEDYATLYEIYEGDAIWEQKAFDDPSALDTIVDAIKQAYDVNEKRIFRRPMGDYLTNEQHELIDRISLRTMAVGLLIAFAACLIALALGIWVI